MTAHTHAALPPEDTNAEEFVLSAALNGPDGVTAARRLATDDFQPGPKQRVHAAILTLYSRGQQINPDTVRDELERLGHPDAGPYLLKLFAYGITGAMAEASADRVLQAANGRRMMQAGQRLTQLAGAEPSDSRLIALQNEMAVFAAAMQGERPTSGRALHAITAAGRPMRAARWLMNLRIPLGAITLLTGREGIGKSTTSYDIIAELTTGRLAGEYYGSPRGCGIVATEDAWEEVILPRLHAAGADRARIFQIDARTAEGYSTTMSVPGDLDRLTTLCVTHDIALIVLDPLMSVIPGGVDTHKDKEVRTVLDPLAQFCSTTGVSVLGLIHVNKSGGHDPLNSIMASRAFTAVARSVLYCIVDPEDEHEDRYLFGHVKSNLGPKQPSMAYRIIQVTIEVESDQPGVLDAITTSRVVWDGEDTRSIASVMEPKRPTKAAGELVQRILEFVTDQPGVVPVKAIVDEMSDVKPNTLRQTLRRMTDRGQLIAPMHGNYTLPPEESDRPK
jgi:AAA domain/DnaB-like helicase N terminal domain